MPELVVYGGEEMWRVIAILIALSVSCGGAIDQDGRPIECCVVCHPDFRVPCKDQCIPFDEQCDEELGDLGCAC